jgi:hypothetical protein
MDNKLLLVKAITLLYRESLLLTKNTNSSDLVRTVLENIKLPELNISLNRERDILYSLKQTALEMSENPPDHEYDKDELLQRLKMNTADDDKLYESLVSGIDPELSEQAIKRTVVNIQKSIHNHFREQKVDEVLSKGSYQFRHQRDKIKNIHTWLSELIANLEPFQVAAVTKDPALVAEVDIGDLNSTQEVFKVVNENSSGKSVIRSGIQGINKMTQGGFRRGESWVVGALQHNFKTGFTLGLFKQFAMYNKPIMIDPKKKPLLVRISFEDEIDKNLQWLYQSIQENETGEKCIAGQASIEEMARYIKERLEINGYHIKIRRVDPTQWTYMHLCNYITELESEGYEIHVLMVDYLAMLPTTGCTIGPMGSDVRDMFRRVRNFCSVRKITFITPHQLSTEAKQLIREQRSDFVKEIANKGYYDKCKTIDQEVDGELYIHIEKKNGKSYLTVQRGKHRIPTLIEDEDKYIVLPFHDVGAIRDDINGPPTHCKKVGGGPVGSGEETPFWEFGT